MNEKKRKKTRKRKLFAWLLCQNMRRTCHEVTGKCAKAIVVVSIKKQLKEKRMTQPCAFAEPDTLLFAKNGEEDSDNCP